MNKLQLAKRFLKDNIYIQIIIWIQVFLYLFIYIPNKNRYLDDINTYRKLNQSNISKSIFYMNKLPVEDEDFVAINIDDISHNEDLLKKVMNKYKKNIIGNSPLINNFSLEYNNRTLSIIVQDDISFSTYMDSESIQKLQNYKGDNIPVLEKKTNKYKLDIGEIVELSSNIGKYNLEVIGYYDNKFEFNVPVNFSNSNDIKISDIIYYKESNLNNDFITLNNKKIENFLENDTYNNKFIYFSNDTDDKIISQVMEEITDNNLGYTVDGKTLLDNEKEYIYYHFKKNIDIIISFLILCIISIFTISILNKNRFLERINFYYINGSTFKDIYMIVFLYYLISFLIPLLIYIIFSLVVESGLLLKTSLFSSALFLNYKINLADSMILSIILILFSFVCTNITLSKIKRFYYSKKQLMEG